MQLISYLNFDGQCREAFTFYQAVLGGKIEVMQSHRESPMVAEVGPEWQDRILHARLVVGNAVLMASDAPPKGFERPAGFAVSLVVDDPGDADRIFKSLAEGGAVRMPIQQTFWAPRFGMLTDRFGTPWIINCDKPA